MKQPTTCQRFSILMPCQNKAVVLVGDEWLCRECAEIEKGRLEASRAAIVRALGKADARLKSLKGVRSKPCDSAYRVCMRADGEEDDV